MHVATVSLKTCLAGKAGLLGIVAVSFLGYFGKIGAKATHSDFAVVPAQSDFGGVGVFQTPTARMHPDGFFSVGYSHVHPFNRIRFSLQFLPWLETVFRYTEITTSSFGRLDEDQTYKDRSLDFKFNLWEESRYIPELSVGFRDLVGTGLFASEYLVASKRYNNFDFSLGLGWGAFAASNTLNNPLTELFSGFEDRNKQTDQGGKFATDSIFRGERVGLFGSMTYELETLPMALHVEYDSSNQLSPVSRLLPLPGRQRLQPSNDPFPLNVGFSYRFNSDIDARFALERGDTLMAAVSIALDTESEQGLPNLNPRPGPIPDRASTQLTPAESAMALDEYLAGSDQVSDAFSQNKVKLLAARRRGRSLDLLVANTNYRHFAQALGRTVHSVYPFLPERIGEISTYFDEGGLVVNRVDLIKDHIVAASRGAKSIAEVWESADIRYNVDEHIKPEDGWHVVDMNYPVLTTTINPKYRQHVGGPGGFVLWQLYLSLGAKLDVSKQSYFQGEVFLDIYNTFDQITVPSNSVLPRVRSDIKEYLQQGTSSISLLDFTHQTKFKPHLYGRVSLGIFEWMYGGVGAEVLYYPLDGDLAIGADINWVKQREFDGLFGFRDYSITTGHVNVYYDMPFYDMRSVVHVGRYLAGDYGITLDVSRVFDGGFRFGAFATLTDVPFSVFGEGSFDKGIYLSFPFDLLSFDSVRGAASFAFRPLTRDGGQMVSGSKRLYGLVRDTLYKDFYNGWTHLLD